MPINYKSVKSVTYNGTPIPFAANLQSVTSTITENGYYTIPKDSSYDGIGNLEITINVSVPEPTPGSIVGPIDCVRPRWYMSSSLTTFESTARIVNEYAFYQCPSLTTVKVPNAEFIGMYAFETCSRLTSVSIPAAKYIANDAFENCYNLQSISCSTASYVGWSAFKNNSSLREINFASLEVILPSAFQSCSLLKTYSLPNVLNVGSNAFESDLGLKKLSFSNVMVIYKEAFKNCKNVTEIRFDNITATQGSEMYSHFAGCSAAYSIYFPQLRVIGNSMFAYCTAIESIGREQFPELQYICPSGFQRCSGLKTVYFSGSIGMIDYRTFESCIGLTNVTFESIGVVGSEAFRNCYKLRSATFGGFTYFSEGVFSGCKVLESIYLPYNTICTLQNSNVFRNTTIDGVYSYVIGRYGSIYVPASLVASYKTAYMWSYYSNRIAAI